MGHDVCKPLQLGRLIMDCVTLLVRCRVILPQVDDQLPQEFQEHVTVTQGPAKYSVNLVDSPLLIVLKPFLSSHKHIAEVMIMCAYIKVSRCLFTAVYF